MSNVESMSSRFHIAAAVTLILYSTSSLAGSGRFAVAGVKDAEVHAFFLKFKAAVINHDVKKVASMASYPLMVNGKFAASNRLSFISHYDVIFTPKVVGAIKHQTYQKLWSNYEGVMIGDGEVWFGGICSDQSCSKYEIKILSVNN